MPWLKADAKYRTRHAHHTLIEELEQKYCLEPTDEPVLLTKSHHQRGSYVTIRSDFLRRLLDFVREHGVETFPPSRLFLTASEEGRSDIRL